MLFRLDNIDSRGVIWKILRSKDLQLSKNILNGLERGRLGAIFEAHRRHAAAAELPHIDLIIGYWGFAVCDGGHA